MLTPSQRTSLPALLGPMIRVRGPGKISKWLRPRKRSMVRRRIRIAVLLTVARRVWTFALAPNATFYRRCPNVDSSRASTQCIITHRVETMGGLPQPAAPKEGMLVALFSRLEPFKHLDRIVRGDSQLVGPLDAASFLAPCRNVDHAAVADSLDSGAWNHHDK